jgi:glycosyltransferase involved in cell wall biosynthesis
MMIVAGAATHRESLGCSCVILFIHNRYRVSGGEERAVANLMWLVREQLGEEAELLERDSALLDRSQAARGMLRGGLDADEVARAVRRTGARVVHAHNIHPAFGWRALAAARQAGARVVLQLHQYRLVCAVGVCFTAGAECTRCHARNTLPGVLRNCRSSHAEALVYAASLAGWQRRIVANVDAFVVPSEFAATRLRELGAPIGGAHVVPHPLRDFAERAAPKRDGYALFAGRLEPEKGLDTAIEACRLAGIPLVVAGTGSERVRFEGASDVTFAGAVDQAELARLRAGAGVAIVPSRFAETYGLAAAEAMAAGRPAGDRSERRSLPAWQRQRARRHAGASPRECRRRGCRSRANPRNLLNGGDDARERVLVGSRGACDRNRRRRVHRVESRRCSGCAR